MVGNRWILLPGHYLLSTSRNVVFVDYEAPGLDTVRVFQRWTSDRRKSERSGLSGVLSFCGAGVILGSGSLVHYCLVCEASHMITLSHWRVPTSVGLVCRMLGALGGVWSF